MIVRLTRFDGKSPPLFFAKTVKSATLVFKAAAAGQGRAPCRPNRGKMHSTPETGPALQPSESTAETAVANLVPFELCFCSPRV
jgi:hypothetical protein